MSIKSSIGKLMADATIVLAAVEEAGFTILPISSEHAACAATLPPIHRDPFDRMLVAQAFTEPMILLTNDTALTGYGALVTLA